MHGWLQSAEDAIEDSLGRKIVRHCFVAAGLVPFLPEIVMHSLPKDEKEVMTKYEIPLTETSVKPKGEKIGAADLGGKFITDDDFLNKWADALKPLEEKEAMKEAGMKERDEVKTDKKRQEIQSEPTIPTRKRRRIESSEESEGESCSDLSASCEEDVFFKSRGKPLPEKFRKRKEGKDQDFAIVSEASGDEVVEIVSLEEMYSDLISQREIIRGFLEEKERVETSELGAKFKEKVQMERMKKKYGGDRPQSGEMGEKKPMPSFQKRKRSSRGEQKRIQRKSTDLDDQDTDTSGQNVVLRKKKRTRSEVRKACGDIDHDSDVIEIRADESVVS
jgi:hypothetical protein